MARAALPPAASDKQAERNGSMSPKTFQFVLPHHSRFGMPFCRLAQDPNNDR